MIEHPILYSFRRCPYAMRARLAIKASGIKVELREIQLKNKPPQMLNISKKATVPVLQLCSGQVIDESIDIMYWALNEKDPMKLLNSEYLIEAKKLIDLNDNYFKSALDKYKYAVRFPEHSESEYRNQCEFFLEQLNNQLKDQPYLLASEITIADYAIFPFIRQFASVDKNWFQQTHYHALIHWLNKLLSSDEFISIMKKYNVWDVKDESINLIY